MSLYRGAGGASDATDDSTVNAVAGYASSAASSATSAANSATAASTSASSAATSASGAATSASSVATNATNAASSASSANTYATQASNSKDAAAASATIASTRAGEASSSASGASSSAATATTKAGEASTSATASAASAVSSAASAASALAIYGNTAAVNAAVAAAAASATTSTTQAANSAASAGDAADSESLAFEHEQNAAEWASFAQGSANSAQGYSTAALAARDATLAAYDSFDDRYLGVKNADPTLDNDGNALLAGSLYFNSTTNMMMLRAGNAWVAAYTSGGSPSFGNTVVNGTLGVTGATTLSAGTANGVTYLNGSKVLTSGSALTFDGTNLQVGTGTASATRTLNVLGSQSIERYGATPQLAIRGGTDSTTGKDVRFNLTQNSLSISAATIGGAQNQWLAFDFTEPSTLFYTDGTERMRLTSTGLGIGTSSPQSRLEVRQDQSGAITRVIANNNFANTGAGSSFDYYFGTTRLGGLTHAFAASGAYLGFDVWNGSAATERMRLDTSGNLGIGTSSPGYKVHTVGTAGFANNGNENLFIIDTVGVNRSSLQIAGSVNYLNANIDSATHGQFVWRSSNAYTERMRLDSSGNLGIGTSSPITKLQVSGTNATLTLSDTAASGGSYSNLLYRNTDGLGTAYNIGAVLGLTTSNGGNGALAFYTAASNSNAERMRLDSSGNLLVGTTTVKTTDAAYKNITLNGNITVGPNLGAFTPDATINIKEYGGISISFFYGTTKVGSITNTASTTAYNTSSDYRLKNVTGPITTSGAYIDSLNPVEGTWKADGSTFVGLIAHEAQEVSRTQVATGTKDGEEMQGMSYSSSEMIANMIAELKALRARVAALEAA